MNKNKLAKQLIKLAKSLISAGSIVKSFKQYGSSISASARFLIPVENQTPDFVKELINRGEEEIFMAMKSLEKAFDDTELCKFSFDKHQLRINGWDSESIIIVGTSPIEYNSDDKEKPSVILPILSVLKSQGFSRL